MIYYIHGALIGIAFQLIIISYYLGRLLYILEKILVCIEALRSSEQKPNKGEK